MDVLSDVLSAVRLTGAIFFDHHVQGPFAGASPASEAIAAKVMPGAEHVIQFHAVLSGLCWTALIEDPASSRPLEAGDIVIYPMGDTNLMSSSPGYVRRPRDSHVCAPDEPASSVHVPEWRGPGELSHRVRLSRL